MRPWRWFPVLFLLLFIAAGTAPGQQDTWSNVERIVAIGDVHGDYAALTRVLSGAGLIDRRAKWTRDYLLDAEEISTPQ
ncbi:MAG TPA: hypothetical protein VN442_18810 [Bryobacteraceae bacterium]|nr:hypothetical protein [Bryobacteraceae bacterium]